MISSIGSNAGLMSSASTMALKKAIDTNAQMMSSIIQGAPQASSMQSQASASQLAQTSSSNGYTQQMQMDATKIVQQQAAAIGRMDFYA
ncbi:hypothetical protein CIG11343_1177 [Campylobacter iguaniorum]|uniref:hypothetical protein n=1 Tax=Campylobacter iguaniorum TaxID=1244531 RepID=UPI0007C98434|nr:hypothetical protein [Campylobacter iguaniorum]ANE36190.1 hypothetical protein CIG11343_1177 [Campylobacter iguaniorum]